MCRLYGFRANELTKVECTLVHAQNALMIQSKSDMRGKAHADGWGIACYDDDIPQVERRETAAFHDLHFSATAERVYARTVVAHVRRATVGTPSRLNTHPFRYGRWVCAHNGTVTAFDRVRPYLEANTEKHLLEARQGTTDSELMFCWLLGRLEKAGFDIDSKSLEPAPAAEVFGNSIAHLASVCDENGAERPAQLNVLLTNGIIFLASRWNHTLFWVERHGVHDCEICGIPHIHHLPGGDYRAVVIASEPISHEEWQPLPEGSVLSVDKDLRSRIHSIQYSDRRYSLSG